ncbi:phytase [Marinihelvus fidelis]|uniref:Phytase n=1 Tax=Marinihelvus fidelis TaxID=2613842 RepID=A0A5N0T9J7_9GAMM|nr:phytase [Marinihelvus fidelis]KAA9131622.1 phytase [Marinihelvus fidelis]
MMNRLYPLALATSLLATQATTVAVADDGDAVMPSISPAAHTQPAALGAAIDAAFWPHADRVVLLAAEGEGGLNTYGTDGQRLQAYPDVQAGMVEVLRDGQSAPVAAIVYDGAASTLSPWQLTSGDGQLAPLAAEPIPVHDELTGLCSYRSTLSGAWFLYGTTDEGLLHHWELYRDGDRWQGRLLRTIPAGKGAGFCAVDAGDAAVYVGDEELGIWRFGAEPEADTTRELIDLVTPRGQLGEEIKGIAVYSVSPELAYLLVADAGEGYLSAYGLPDGDRVGAIAIDGLSEAEGMAALATTDGGWLAIADEDQSDGASEYALVPWEALAAELGLAARAEAGAQAPRVATVTATVETEVVASWGDAADDPAIWVNPNDPEASLVFGTDKKGGLHVYNLAGESLQFFAHGRINNVDLRDGFELDGKTVTLVTASNRTQSNISIYAIDPATATVTEIADGLQPTGLPDPYGMCMYRDAESGAFYVFVNGSGDGLTRQYELTETSKGKVSAKQVREIEVGGQAEGCVADDNTGTFYIAQEDYGLWKYSASADAGNERSLIDSVEGEHMVADIEGISIWHGANGGGYIVASNQGENSYLLYRLEGEHDYVGKFHVVADPASGIDGVSETDGLDVTSAPLGDTYPQGMLAVQDGRNIAPAERQNFKFVSWADIAEALELE